MRKIRYIDKAILKERCNEAIYPFVYSIIMSSRLCHEQKKAIVLPDDLPDFVQESDFASINWDKQAEVFGDRGSIVGNINKSGVIGADAPSLSTQKWMWHLWGIELPLTQS